MRNGRGHTVAVSVGGMLGGALGTAAVKKAMGLTDKLPEPLHMPSMADDPGAVRRREGGGGAGRPAHAGDPRARGQGRLLALRRRLGSRPRELSPAPFAWTARATPLLAGAALGAVTGPPGTSGGCPRCRSRGP